MKRFLLAMCVLTLLAGCGLASIQTISSTSQTFPPRRPADVILYQQEPPYPYFELATLITENYSQASTGPMYDQIIEKAAGLGADGVIIREHGLRPAEKSGEMQLWAKAVAVRFHAVR